jgi:predicted SAM-dependent methyltransferase
MTTVAPANATNWPKPAPPELLEESGVRLHIGGTVRKEGWVVLNARPGDHVDLVADLRDISSIASGSFDLVYASHVIEHLSYMHDLPRALAELARVLRPSGRLCVSVPDLPTLCRLYADPNVTPQERFHLMRVIFGGQTHAFDFHYVGFDSAYLTELCLAAGFSAVYETYGFDFFDDTSKLTVLDVPISLNMVAVR